MNETTSSVWTFQMIIIFMLIFAGFLALVLVYSKAYTIKNSFISTIEKYDGISSSSLSVMNKFAENNGYTAKANCPKDDKNHWYGVIIADDIIEEAKDNVKYNYCFSGKIDEKGLTYYDIEIFYKFSLPFFETLGLYRIKGHTNSFNPANDIIM